LDAQFMQLALEQARLAASKDEVPVGAVLVASDGHTVLATSHNQCHTTSNPTAHAEMLAIQEAAAKLGAWRLLGCTLYVTLEPCPMCEYCCM
jgi:tRNA(adenine34) deaminase